MLKSTKAGLVRSLLGESRDAKFILSNYKKMIRVLPDQVNFKRIDKFREDVKYKITKPHPVYTE